MNMMKHRLLATIAVLAVTGLLTHGCCKGDKEKKKAPEEEAVKKQADELLNALKTLGQPGKKLENMPSTNPAEAKLTVDEPSIKVVKTRYSTIVYCYVKNDGTAPNGATLKATFKDASGTIVGTATGSASDIMPGSKKPAQLYSSDKVGNDATVKVELDYVHGFGNTGEADIETSNITVKKQYGMPKVMGEITNKGSAAHSLTPQAVFLDKDGGILSVAFCGPVNDLDPGAKKTFDCTSSEKLKSWDTVQVIVGTMLK
jgi:hypothetical protein